MLTTSRTSLAAVGPASGLDVIGYWGEGGGPDVAVSLGATGAAGDHFVDGAIGSRTAVPARAVCGLADPRGRLHDGGGSFAITSWHARRAGVQAGYHVIGDGAMDLVVAGFERGVRGGR